MTKRAFGSLTWEALQHFLQGVRLGNATSATAGVIRWNGSNYQGYNGSAWVDLDTVAAHSTTHKNGGGDEVATATPAANAIPKAGPAGTLDAGWISGGGVPAAHATSHQNGGSDELSVAGLNGLLADAQTPTSHATSHNAGGGDAMAIDAAAGTGSLRTLGTAATAACAGNDTRLSDARTPTSHATSHNAGGGDAMAIDAAAGTGSLRTLGTAATAACAGNDGRLSDARTPTAHSTSHKNGGGDEVATATPGANAIPKADGTGKLAAGWLPAGIGDVVGPASSTDNQIARYDLATGKLIQTSPVTIADNGDTVPTSNDASDLGTPTLRWAEIRARILVAVSVSGAGVVTIPASAQGGVVGGAATGLGTSLLQMGGGSFPPVALFGNTYATTGLSARMRHFGGGSFMTGSAFASGAGSAYINSTSTSYGSFTGGYAVQFTLAGSTTIKNDAPGSFLWAYPSSTGSGATYCGIPASGEGAFLVARTSGVGAHTARASGAGSFVQGLISGPSAGSLLSGASATGSFVQGAVSGGATLQATAAGAFAQGNAQTNNITASGAGSMAVGSSTSGAIVASAANAVQFGPGTNAETNTLKVGASGLRFKGTTGAPGTLVVGDVWVDAGGFVVMRSPTGSNLSFTKPTITGAKGGNAALTSLLSALATMGLVVDSTT